MSQVGLPHLHDKSIGEVAQPRPLPTGRYGWVIAGRCNPHYTRVQHTDAGFVPKFTEGTDNVDQGASASAIHGTERRPKLTVRPTEDSLGRLKEFCGLLGITSEDDDRPLGETLPEATSQQFVARIVHETIEGTTDVIAKLDDRSIAADE